MISDITTKTPQEISEYYKQHQSKAFRAILKRVSEVKAYKVKSGNLL